MQVISGSGCIRCYFDSGSEMTSEDDINGVEVFYAKTKDLNTIYPDLKNFITKDEQLRADRFHFEEDLETYISCHALLRLILSRKLNTEPLEIIFVNELHNKPVLSGNPLYFNITHTRDAFAFAVSRNHYVGIDLEKVNRGVDFISIIETYFSTREREYILESETDAINRFFLLWTRKEALLKALGIGIINDLTQIEVSEQENVINKKLLNKSGFNSVSNEHFIYSKRLLNNYISIAIPQKAEIIFNKLTVENIDSYLD